MLRTSSAPKGQNIGVLDTSFPVALDNLLNGQFKVTTLSRLYRVWSWLKLRDDETGYSSEQEQPVRDWLAERPAFRRKIQRMALDASDGDDGPWMAIVHDLPSANRGLALSIADAAEFLDEIGSKNVLSDFDIQLWVGLVQSQQGASGLSEGVGPSVLLGTTRHPILGQHWEELTAPPKRDWRKEEQDLKLQRKQDRDLKFAEYRASFWPSREKIAAGEEIEALKRFAKAYMGRYSDLNRDARPDDRIRELLGEELANAALAALSRPSRGSIFPARRKLQRNILKVGAGPSSRC